MWQFVVDLYSGFLIRKRVIKQRMGEGLAEDLWLNVGRGRDGDTIVSR